MVVVGQNLELTIPLKIEQPLVDPAYTGSIIVKGTIVAVAPINPLPETVAVPVTIEVMPADDPPRAQNDGYVTRQNQALAVSAGVVSVEETVGAEMVAAMGVVLVAAVVVVLVEETVAMVVWQKMQLLLQMVLIQLHKCSLTKRKHPRKKKSFETF